MTRIPALLAPAALLLSTSPVLAQWPPAAGGPPGQAPAHGAPAYAPPAPAPPSVGLPAGMPAIIEPAVPLPGAREVEQRLDEAKRVDAGRKLEWVWIDAHGGFEQVGLTTFHGDAKLAGGPTTSSGGVIGAGVGARLLFFTLLLRGRVGFGSIGQLYRVGPEIGLHVPLGRVEPHIDVGGGYAAFGHLATAGTASPVGGYGRVGAGLDYFVAPVLSLGADVSAEILGTHQGDASGLGGAVAATAVVGLHL